MAKKLDTKKGKKAVKKIYRAIGALPPAKVGPKGKRKK